MKALLGFLALWLGLIPHGLVAKQANPSNPPAHGTSGNPIRKNSAQHFVTPEWPSGEWPKTSPAEAGLDEDHLLKVRDYALTGGGSGCIVRGGKLVISWGDPRTLYDLKSSSKSIGVTALGLALLDGKVALDEKAKRFLPTFGLPPESNAQTGWLDTITLRHLANQTAGFEKPGGFTRLQFEPGTKWHYSDGGPNWLAECLTLAYERDLNEVMFERVFTPLGITTNDIRWRRNAYRPHLLNGLQRREFGSGFSANVDAMARIGYLYLRKGKWQSRQIIPADFVQLAGHPARENTGLPELDHTHGNASDHYSLLWWNNGDGTLPDAPRDAFWSWGLYDSLIVVIPSLDLVAARAGKSWQRTTDSHYEVLKPFLQPLAAAALESQRSSTSDQPRHSTPPDQYFPPPESAGGWRMLQDAEDIRQLAGADPEKLGALKEWLLQSDDRNFAAVVVRRGYIVLQVERGNNAATDSRRVASVSKAVCATVLAIASQRSQDGMTPRKMQFDDPAFDFIPWAQPLSDPRKGQITVKQLLNHTSGICPEATGAPNDGDWEYILGHSGDKRTEQLAFEPGAGCGYSTHALAHAALVCETVTGQPYDRFAVESFFKPLGIEHWWFQYYEGGKKYGRHPSHGLGLPARDLARIAYCMLRDGRWRKHQVIPRWFVDETAAPTHEVKTPEMRWKLNPQVFSHGWELPARHWPESGRNGEGIPADARSKPGSGGQLMAFVPSLDLVIARQTGSSGNWEYEEFLRRACAAMIGR